MSLNGNPMVCPSCGKTASWHIDGACPPPGFEPDRARYLAMALAEMQHQTPVVRTRPTGATRAAAVVWIIIGLLVLSPCILALLFVFLNAVFQALGFYS